MSRLVIEIVGKSDDIDVSPFVHVLQTTVGLLKDLEANISPESANKARWRIEQVTKGGPLKVIVSPNVLELNPEVLPTFLNGLRLLEDGHDVVPDHFHEEQLNKTKSIVAVLSDKSLDGIARITYSSPNAGTTDVAVTPTLRMMSHIEMMIGPHYERWASFEGTLEVVNFHGTKREFNIYDVITNRKIICSIAPDLQERVPVALLKRVQVYGIAKFNRENKPLSIKVERFKVYRTRAELPQLRDLTGIDITGGQDSTVYVRSLRDV